MAASAALFDVHDEKTRSTILSHSGPSYILSMSSPTHWSLPFLQTRDEAPRSKTALIILNQPFSKALLRRLWQATDWHCCADGGANRLHDVLNCDATDTTTATAASSAPDRVDEYLPDLLKGDLDSVRDDVRRYYETRVSRCSC